MSWELYDLSEDFSQAHDLAAADPEKLAAMKARFLEVAEENKDFPIGAGNWLRLHPEDRIASPYDSWTFGPNVRRMPEFTAPGVGRQSTTVTIDAEFGEDANGVLYAVGGAGGGLSVYMQEGELVYEYNMMIIENYQARTGRSRRASTGSSSTPKIARPAGPAEVVVTRRRRGGGADRRSQRTVPAAFTATESFDVGIDLGSPVSRAYAEARPFAFDGSIGQIRVTQ